MNFARRLAVWVATSLLFTSLIAFVYSWVFLHTFADRTVVKSWVEDSGTYSALVSEVVSVSSSQAANEGTTVNAEILDAAANSAFTPLLLQESTEGFFDGTYDWLEGKTETLQFSVDLTAAKQTFADSLTQSADQILTSLPVCPDGEVVENLDPFSATCVPEGFDFSQSADEFTDSIVSSDEFLPEPIVTEQNTLIDNDGQKQTIDQRLSLAPTLFTLARFGTILFFVLGLASTAVIFWLTTTRGKAIFRLFKAFAITAISVGLFTFVSSRSSAWLESAFSASAESQSFGERIVAPIVQAAASDITAITLLFTWIYTGIAVALLLLLLVLRRRKRKLQDTNTQKLENQQTHENTNLQSPDQAQPAPPASETHAVIDPANSLTESNNDTTQVL